MINTGRQKIKCINLATIKRDLSVNVFFCKFFLRRIAFLSGFIGISFFCTAQLCTGSLGDPVINMTFGSGTNYGQGVTAPGYAFVSSSCPNDGYYTFTAATVACFGNSWHTVNADHTGNGNFMLVNASFQPGDFFLSTVSGLCPNTTYEFSAWIMNVLISQSGIQPNITFSIETPAGVILNQFNTGGIAVTSQPAWKQYGFFFTTTAGIPDIVLRMTNNAPGGIGNDVALDDITFRPCGPVLTSSIQGNSDTVDICVYEQVGYTFTGAVSPGFLSPVFQWQVSTNAGTTWNDIPGATALTYQRPPTVAGNFLYRLSVAEGGNGGIAACRIGSNILTIDVHARPTISAGPDRILFKGGSAILAATTTDNNNIVSWSPPDYLDNTAILNPTASPDKDMSYSLFAVSQFGCTNTDQVLVKVVSGIFVPTAFTPDNNGKNDSWRISFLDPVFGATVNVYNRWGQLIYQAIGTAVNWDGNYRGMPQPAGTYVYTIHFKSGPSDMKGILNLIR